MAIRPRFTLTRKALAAVIIILLPVVFTFVNDYRQNRHFLEERVLNDLETVTEAYEGQIFLFIEMSKRRAMDFASGGFIRDRLEKIRSGRLTGKDAGEELSGYLRKDKLPVIEHVRTIHVISTEGRVVASTDPGFMGADVSGSRYFKEAVSGPHASETDMAAIDGPGLVISVPVRETPGGEMIGVIANFMSISELNSVLTGELVARLGALSTDKGRPETMESYLVNRDRVMITGSKFVPRAVLRQKVDTAPVRACLESSTEMTGFYPDYRGIMVAGSSMCIPRLGWTLLVEVDEAETMAPLAAMRRNAVITAAVVAALIVALLLLFIRRVVRPLKRVEEASRKIEEGGYDIDLPVDSNDEVGLLAGTFNTMALDIETRTIELKKSERKYRSLVSHIPDVVWTTDERGNTAFMSPNVAGLTGYTAEELCGQTARLWFGSIHTEDLKMVQDAFYSLFYEGTEFDVEYRFRRKDGEWLWINDRATSTYEKDGVRYADGVLYDITERKRAEEALVRNEKLLREAQQIGRMGSWDWDIVNNTLMWSDEIYRIFGLDPQEFDATYEAFIDRVHPGDRETVQGAVHRALYDKVPYSIDHRIVLQSGEQKVVHEQAEVHFGPTGAPVRMTGTVQDITARKRAEEEIESLARFPSENPNPVMRISKEGTVLYANLASRPILEEFHTAVGGRLAGRWRELVDRTYSTVENAEAEVSHDGAIFSVVFTPVRGSDYIYIYGRDITERRLAEFELKKLSMAIEQSVNIVFITNIDGVIEYVNPRFEEVTGYTKEEVIGQTPRVLASGETPQTAYEELWNSVLAGKTWRGSLKNKTKTRGNYWCNTVISPIRDDHGEITHLLAVQEDVTERMKSEERIDYLAHFDPLTGLVNRTHFMKRMDEWIGVNGPKGSFGALMLLDIDQFKFLNDTYGHGAGDELLRRLAEIIDASARRACGRGNGAGRAVEDPIVGRLSGDEFAVFFPGFDAGDAEKGAEAIRADIENARFSETIGTVTASVGMVTYPDLGTDTRQLLSRADAAMFRAKDLGRNRTHVYRSEDKDLEKMHSRLRWKGKILKALREDRIVPWFQPILDLRDNRVHHYEVLARMQDEDGKILLPGAFIEVAERFGLVGSIDRVIIEKAIATQSRLSGEGRRISFAANLSGKDIGDEELLVFIQNKLRDAGTARGCMTFEITETATISDLGRATGFIRSLKGLGCKFSLDDFGVGFTSFTYLKEMDVDFLKIDGSFIRRLHENPKDQALVKAIIEVARGLDIKTIAEFVENEETLGLLREFGVDYAQGYLIGKPAPVVAPAEDDEVDMGSGRNDVGAA